MTKKRDLKDATTAAKEPASGNNLGEAPEPRGPSEATACVKTPEGEVVCGILVGGGSLGTSSAPATAPPAAGDGTLKGNE